MSVSQISIVIPVKDGRDVFDECLTSVRKALHGENAEIIVVDDGSSDDSTAIIAEKHCCVVERLPVCKGPANARNVGAGLAQNEIILFIDSDVLLQNDTLVKISEVFANADVVGLTGVLSDKLRFTDFFSQFKNLWMRYTYINLPQKVALFYTSCAAIRKSVFLQSGGFDSGYTRPSVEDTDFGQKLQRQGYLLNLASEIEVEHVKSYAFCQVLKTDFYRASDLVRMTLRNGFSKLFRGNSTSVPSSFFVNVLLFLFQIVIYPVVFLSAPLSVSSVLLAMLLLCFYLANLSFLKWINQQRGTAFTINTFLFLLIDVPVVTLGIIHGVSGFLMGKKY